MYTDNSASLQTSLVEQAGTLDFHSLNQHSISNLNGSHAGKSDSCEVPKSPGTPSGEQALEWHEVIELQAFSERKAWIEQKIKFLEQMPPIEVFAGLDAVRQSAEVVAGLPSRAELDRWIQEHDRIEKETEIFDSGEMTKLRKFTKAATQRNLSPADTDLIELTLTTILELDRLLRLLRDRSDNIELLAIRLTWEERRINAWRELRSILADLQHFLDTRARWSPSIYDTSLSEDEEQNVVPDPPKDFPSQVMTHTLRRKGSIVSLASSTSESIVSSLALSRSERFRLAERLSRDAAQFASRVSSLKHSKINAAGKALDQLIDTSRKPVPDELLDEQDKLEDEGINAMEDVGKFIMSVVMQWKKADEIYVETVRDKNTAQTLLEEIETAKLFHPTSRQDSAFLARVTTLSKRLAMRTNPAAPNSSFPRPYHPLFESQEESNTVIVETLSNELAAAWEHTRKAEAAAKEYHAKCEAIKKVETVCKAARELSLKFESILSSLQHGSGDDAGEGVPPDLTDERCLQLSRHSVFLSHLSSLVNDLRQADVEAAEILESARSALLDASRSGIDHSFISESVASIDRLDELRAACSRAQDTILGRASTLKRVREIWANMAEVLEELDEVRSGVLDATRLHGWQSQSQEDAALLTPESPTSLLPASDLSPADAAARLDGLAARSLQDISSPLGEIAPSLGPDLRTYLEQCSSALQTTLVNTKRLLAVWKSVRNQAEEMRTIQAQAYALQLRSEDLKLRYENVIHETLSEKPRTETSLSLLTDELYQLRSEISGFVDDLPKRITFVAQGERVKGHASLGSKRHFSVSGFSLNILQEAATTDSPLDLASLDRAVRTDVNAYSMTLTGVLDALDQKSDLLRLANLARDADARLATPTGFLQKANEAMDALQSTLDERSDSLIALDELSALSDQVDQLYPQYGPAILASLSSHQRLLEQLQDGLSRHEPVTARRVLEPRLEQMEDLKQQFDAWKESVEVLSERISDLRHLEQVRLAEAERLRLEEVAMQRAEGERLAREAQERAEQERLEAEARRKEAADMELPFNLVSDEEVLLEQALASQDFPVSRELSELQTHVRLLRKRLSAIDIDNLARANAPISAALPANQQVEKLDRHLSVIVDEVNTLPTTVAGCSSIDDELSSLRAELIVSSRSIERIKQLSRVASTAQHCDDALSDLLEHVDSFPAPPAGPLASSFSPDLFMPPEEQLSARLSFTRGLIHDLLEQCADLVDDTRAISERDRILRTWDELQSMAHDRLNGQKSRPPSVMSSGRSSRASIISVASSTGASATRAAAFPRRDSSRASGQFLAPPPAQHVRRVTSAAASVNGHSRSSSRASVASKRSVSGPVDVTPTSSRLQASTYASRQRSASVTSTSSPLAPPTVRKPSNPPPLGPPATITRPRAHTAQSRRASSPAFSESSNVSRSRSSLHMSQPSTSRSTWSRAPRASFPTLPMVSPPRRRQRVTQTKPYVPNPKNKLDVALGDVVNSLPVDINIEVVEDTWRDQSGKYWIGGEDPKLCFCRILRSQTVMVRVGGGWTELSKFIKEHFADAFRLLPESPPRPKASEEKWISSATLAQMIQTQGNNPTSPPRTPEPKSPRFLPSFAVSTPSPPSVASSPGSPLRAIQFIRRADRESPIFRPETPTKPSRTSIPQNTPRQPVWRP